MKSHSIVISLKSNKHIDSNVWLWHFACSAAASKIFIVSERSCQNKLASCKIYVVALNQTLCPALSARFQLIFMLNSMYSMHLSHCSRENAVSTCEHM